jgi:hypothetical protein
MADVVRMLLRVGIPILEGLYEAEETMLREYIRHFRQIKKVQRIKDL